MKQIPLTQGLFALVDDEDFERLSCFNWRTLKGPRTHYAARTIALPNGRRMGVQMHREILGLTDPRIKVDHRDGNGWRNLRNNLRIATEVENGGNRRKQENAFSIYKGVSRQLTGCFPWKASIMFKQKADYLGGFLTEEGAARAYDKAAVERFGEFAKLNFPP